MSFTSFLATAAKGAKLSKDPAKIAAHFEGLIGTIRSGTQIDAAALSEAKAFYKALIDSTPEAERATVAREFMAQASRDLGGDISLTNKLKDALKPDKIAAKVEKAAEKKAKLGDKITQAVDALAPKTTKVEDLDAALGKLRTDLVKANLIDPAATSKPRNVKDIRTALEGNAPITQAEFTKFAASLRQESLVAEQGRMVTQIERATTTPEGIGQPTGNVLEDLKAGRPVTDSELDTLRTSHATSSNSLGGSARLAEIVEDLDRTRLGLLDGLTVNRTSNFRMNTTEVFRGIREVLERREHPLLLPSVNRAEVVSPREVYSLLRKGEPVSRNELNTLESFYRRHFDVATAPQKKDAPQMPPPIMPGSPTAAGLQFAKGAFDSIMRYADSSGKAVRVSRNVLHEWETGVEPNIASRFANNLRDGSVGAWATALPLAATTAFAGNYLDVRQSPEGVGPGRAFFFGLAFDRDDGTAFEKMPALVNRQFDRLTKTTGSRDLFAEYTEIITGIKIDPTKALDRQKIFEIASVLVDNPKGIVDQAKNPNAFQLSHRFNPETDIVAYTIALGSYAGIDVNTLYGADSKDTSTKDIAQKILAQSMSGRADVLAKRYFSPSNPQDESERDAAFKDFLGTEPPKDREQLHDALLDKFSKMGSASASQFSSHVVAEYLVLAQILSPEKKSATDALDVIKNRTALKGETETKERERQLKAAERASIDNAEAIALEVSGKKPAAPSPEQGKKDDISAIFNKLTADDDLGLKGQGETLKAAYNKAVAEDGSVEKGKFNTELEKAKIPAEQRKMLLEFVR